MLYIVATPIGNLEEITFRAVEVLKSVDVIAAEDTRHTLILLNKYQIKNKVVAYQKFNERAACGWIIEMLKEGKNVALVSDAGMPLISDPGWILVDEAIKNQLEYTVIGGGCAAISALVLSGLNTTRFAMLGFLPEKNIDKERLLEKYKELECTLIFYSAPHDVKRHLSYLYSMLGRRRVAIVREISKVFEEVVHGELGEDIELTEKGEMVIVVEGMNLALFYNSLSIVEHYEMYIKQGMTSSLAMKRVAFERKISKSVVYKELLEKQ